MTDLIERLRQMAARSDANGLGRHSFDIGDYWNVVEEAADELERLRNSTSIATGALLSRAEAAEAEVERLRAWLMADPGALLRRRAGLTSSQQRRAPRRLLLSDVIERTNLALLAAATARAALEKQQRTKK